MRSIGLCMVAFILIQCITTNDAPEVKEAPEWVSMRISLYQKEEMQNPPRKIWEYDTLGYPLFKITSSCCDGFDSLFSSDGKFFCALGGFTGKGDGNCPESIQSETDIELIWSDTRTPKINLPKMKDSFSGDEMGCSDFRAFRQNESGKSILGIYSNTGILRDTSYDIDLEKSNELLINIDRYSLGGLLREVYCNDVMTTQKPIETLNAISGKIHVDVFNFQPGWFKTYQVNVRGRDIVFKNGEKSEVLDAFHMDSVYVGWLPG